jgi:hypothetical protein
MGWTALLGSSALGFACWVGAGRGLVGNQIDGPCCHVTTRLSHSCTVLTNPPYCDQVYYSYLNDGLALTGDLQPPACGASSTHGCGQPL